MDVGVDIRRARIRITMEAAQANSDPDVHHAPVSRTGISQPGGIPEARLRAKKRGAPARTSWARARTRRFRGAFVALSQLYGVGFLKTRQSTRRQVFRD